LVTSGAGHPSKQGRRRTSRHVKKVRLRFSVPIQYYSVLVVLVRTSSSTCASGGTSTSTTGSTSE
jgi:hypothetical protein